MPKEDSKRMNNLSLSKLQSPMTTKWLHENYEMSEGVSLPRSSLYSHYLDFCNKTNLQPVNAASFGKIIRHTFPSLKTRRLGTRGQSKYHYYGISVKDSSPYHETVFTAVRQSSSSFSQSYSKAEMDERTVNTPSKNQATAVNSGPSESGMLLPDFPSVESIKLPDFLSKDKVKTFLIMYRAHCQRILDTILRANFSEVQNFLVHFWQGMPGHIAVILDQKDVIDLIATCDNILYKAISGVLIPGALQPLPASLTQAIRQFANQLCSWLELSLHHLPDSLQEKKLTVAKAFSQLLCRQTSLSHLAQAARSVLHSTEPVHQMSSDLQEVDIRSVLLQAMWASPSADKRKEIYAISKFFKEFSVLLEQQASVDQYAEWVASLIDRCVVKPSERDEGTFQTCAQSFLMMWSFITSKIVEELTLKSAQSFGSFHLLQMLFDDYIFFLIESHAIISEDVEEIGEQSHESSEEYSESMDENLAPECMKTFIHRRTLSESSSSGRGSLSSPLDQQKDSKTPTLSSNPQCTSYVPSDYFSLEYEYSRQRPLQLPMSPFYPPHIEGQAEQFRPISYQNRNCLPPEDSENFSYSSVSERVNALMTRDMPLSDFGQNRYFYGVPDLPHNRGFQYSRDYECYRPEIRT